jgi:hypothetical protein
MTSQTLGDYFWIASDPIAAQRMRVVVPERFQNEYVSEPAILRRKRPVNAGERLLSSPATQHTVGISFVASVLPIVLSYP